ncbi:MAG: HPF/RaiA family ribosome-associated protein [Gammaproteobacteria bacterium]|nr:HPF/RaiA family ribosome-associated protein [Gammaproteobacteria bacterium]
MHIPLKVTFRHMEASEAVKTKIKDHVTKLEKYYGRIIGCKVLVEIPHQHHHKGKLYRVQVDLMVPQKEIVANRVSGLNHTHEDVYIAIRDAFRATKRKLEDEIRRKRGKVKTHATLPLGTILALSQKEQYGTIETVDGREIYFHKNSLLNGDLSHLTVGTKVRFLEESGDEGPQASTVKIVKSCAPTRR